MNEGQRKAATHGEGPMLVLAGPGSGKTFVITNRISYLIQCLGIAPQHILVITFTKDAAGSMQRRFQEAQSGFFPVNFGTFHAIFYQILKQSLGKMGKILTDTDKKQIILPILARMQRQLERERAEQNASSRAGVRAGQRGLSSSASRDEHAGSGNQGMGGSTEIQGGFAGTEGKTTAWAQEERSEDAVKCLAAIGYFKNTGQEQKAELMLPELFRGHFRELLNQYEKARAESGGLDFDDMLYSCLSLLRSNQQVLHFWQEQFQYLLIDEFQDINPLQYEIIRLLALPQNHLFVVGDDDQSIYGFRGSEPGLMQQFLKDYPGCEQVLLNLNYRSRPEIVEASLKVIGENKNRFVKDLKSAQAVSEEEARERDGVNDLQCTDHLTVNIKSFSEREEQDCYLVDRISEEPCSEQCAVLFRTNAQMQGFASKLIKAGVPFAMKEKSACIYDHFIAKDLENYIRFANGDHRRSVFLSIVNKPSRWIGRDAVQEEEVNLDHVREYYRQCAPPRRLAQILSDLRKFEEGLKQLRQHRPYLAIQYLRKALGYESYLKQRAGADKFRLSEWMEILEFLTADAAPYVTCQDWLADQQILREEMQKKQSDKTQEQGVRLMTAHASKGLEFKRVYIPEVNEGVYPHGRMPDEDAVEEERRMLYVAMTRAKEMLEMTFVTGTKEHPRLPSRFLNPLL